MGIKYGEEVAEEDAQTETTAVITEKQLEKK